MKGRIAFLSSILVLCVAAAAVASDCVGPGCEIELNKDNGWDDGYITTLYGAAAQTPSAPVAASVAPVTPTVGYVAPVVPQYAVPMQYVYPTQIPMRSVKTLSIKPVPEDTRPAIWDGTGADYKARAYDKTVDWRDGVPIWDDSIVNYKYKDFSDWYLEPLPEIYEREVDVASTPAYGMPMAVVPTTPTVPTIDAYELYTQNMEDAAATRARVEELLSPKRPCSNLWADTGASAPREPFVTNDITVPVASACMPMAPRPQYVAQDMSTAIQAAFGRNDGCPFQTETECNIWRRKPIIRETVSPRSPQIRNESLEEIIIAAKYHENFTANDDVAAPLLDRYKMLMRSARACCTDGMAYQLKKAGASDALIYKFMSDDANFYGFGARCLMMTDAELDEKYPNTSTAVVAADVRNGCLCRGRQWFSAMLAPFQQVYNAAPEFKNQKFYYTYTDGLQRKTTVSVNNDVQNVLNQLSLCP